MTSPGGPPAAVAMPDAAACHGDAAPPGGQGQPRRAAGRDDVAAAADLLGGHDVAVVLGSGWGPAAEALGRTRAETPFSRLPGFPPPGVAGHPGIARTVSVGDARVLVLLGRVHLYEGHDAPAVTHAVRTAVLAGCRVVVLTNAAGGLDPRQRVGQPVLIADHLNLTGASPLVGPRFVDMGEVYSARLRALARTIEPGLAEGVYAQVRGPQYETPAEVRMLRTLGADLVGMSTALEAVAARADGAEVLGLSLVTNAAAGLGPALSHADVLAAGSEAAARMGRLLRRLIVAL